MQEPIFMLNALWFKPEGGEASYRRYLGEAAKVIHRLAIGSETHTLLQPQQAIIGEWDPDLVFVVEYPSREAFDRFVSSEEYQAIRHLREEALEKSLLIQCGTFRSSTSDKKR